MIVAGLDLATTTGLVVLHKQQLMHWEAFRPAGNNDSEIFYNFRTWLLTMLVRYDIKQVGIEQPLRTGLVRRRKDGGQDQISNMRVYLRLYGLRAHAIEVCYRSGVPHQEFHQGTWRKSFLGSGSGKDAKLRALAQCRQLGWNITSKDAAEAAGVAFHLQGELQIAGRAGELLIGGAT